MIPSLPDISNIDMTLVYNLLFDPDIQILLVLAGIAGLLIGKQESNAAEQGIGDKTKHNRSIKTIGGLADWTEDFLYGYFGGIVYLGTIQMISGLPVMMIPLAGFAGRKYVLDWKRRIEGKDHEIPTL